MEPDKLTDLVIGLSILVGTGGVIFGIWSLRRLRSMRRQVTGQDVVAFAGAAEPNEPIEHDWGLCAIEGCNLPATLPVPGIHLGKQPPSRKSLLATLWDRWNGDDVPVQEGESVVDAWLLPRLCTAHHPVVAAVRNANARSIFDDLDDALDEAHATAEIRRLQWHEDWLEIVNIKLREAESDFGQRRRLLEEKRAREEARESGASVTAISTARKNGAS